MPGTSPVVGQAHEKPYSAQSGTAASLDGTTGRPPPASSRRRTRLSKVEFAADDHTANVAVSGTKTAVRQGRKLFQRQREKRVAEKRRENTAPTEHPPPNRPRVRPRRARPRSGTAGRPRRGGRLPRQRTDPPRDGQRPRQGTSPAQDRRLPRQRIGTAPESQPLPRYERTAERPPAHVDIERAWADFCQETGRKVGRAETAGEKPGCSV